MKDSGVLSRALKSIAGCCVLALSVPALAGEPSCRTGGAATAEAFIRMNPVYAMYVGDLESYLANNRAQFRAGGDAVRCTGALSQAFLSSAVQLYDPVDIQRRQELDMAMRLKGIKPGPVQPNAAGMMFNMSMQLSRMARVLPAAADGDYGPMNTPITEFERLQLFLQAALRQHMQDPSFRSALAQVEPLLREAAKFDHYFIRQAAERLANAP